MLYMKRLLEDIQLLQQYVTAVVRVLHKHCTKNIGILLGTKNKYNHQ